MLNVIIVIPDWIISLFTIPQAANSNRPGVKPNPKDHPNIENAFLVETIFKRIFFFIFGLFFLYLLCL